MQANGRMEEMQSDGGGGVDIFEVKNGSWSGDRNSHSFERSPEPNMAVLCGVTQWTREGKTLSRNT